MFIELLLEYPQHITYVIKGKYVVTVDEDKRLYKVSLKEDYINLIPIIRELSSKYPVFDPLKDFGEVNFQVFYDLNVSKIEEELSKYPLNNYRDVIADLIFWESLNLSRLSPLLHDENINEIFINGEDTPVYIDHRKYGTLQTNIVFTKPEILSLLRLLEFIKGEGIDPERGSIEADLYNSIIHYRVNIDAPPLTYGNIIISLRNLRQFRYTLTRLLNEGSLNIDMASILLLATYSRMNIVIAGPPNSGKTTLLNSLIMLLPKHIRRIFIEEARESPDMRREGAHQIFYRLSRLNKWDKEEQIIFTLRRSPDYVILGETLSKKDVETLFYSLSLGLNIITTIHSSSIDTLIRRWLIHEKIEKAALADIDLIIIMKRKLDSNIRFVKEIYTMSVDEDNNVRVVKIVDKEHNYINDEGLRLYLNRISRKLDIKLEKVTKIYMNIQHRFAEGEVSSYDEFMRWIEEGDV